MHLSRSIKIQLAIFTVVALVFGLVLVFGYIKLPAMFGVGRYSVTMELPRSAGLYPSGNVTYRGTQVGKVESVGLTENGHVKAVLSIYDGVQIPSNLEAEVHSQSALGEQYVALLPKDDTSPPLKNGAVIPLKDTAVPPAIDTVLDATNRGLKAIPHDSLKTAIDESYTALGGLGPEFSRLVKGSTSLAIDGRANLDSLTTLIDQSAPLLNSQADTGSEVQAWAAHLADVTAQLRDNDRSVSGVLNNAGPAVDEARQLFERVQPTLPVILANLVSVGRVAITYQDGLEQLLVLVPQTTALGAASFVANKSNPGHPEGFLDFNLDVNLPPPCTTGYLPASQRRSPALTDAPERIEGDMYCRIPQDAQQDVRGVRNLPCETRPGKRAPTAKMCESDKDYVPLNDGANWKGDPNATNSGQDVPQREFLIPNPVKATAPEAGPPPNPALAVAQYDQATGSYIAPDGKVYTQADLAQNAPQEKTWESMLTPPAPK
ncbi:MCE family protein [Mycobacterium sp. NBC_00419]|uniref:MlaD family protein n=1 Tax=Mycobacterium sp. NBC_00419 TaxID=2975989 RepID=UPI002E200EE9